MDQIALKPYRIAPLSRIILLKLYQRHIADDNRDRYTVEEIRSLFSVPVSRNLLQSSLSLMTKSYANKFISTVGSISGGNRGYRINEEGIIFVEKQLRRKSSDLSYFLANGDSALDDVAGIDGIFWSRDEATSSEDWAPIEFDKASASYLDAVKAVEEAATQIETHNEFADKFPAEREGIIATLEEGLDWLKNKSPTRSQIRSQILAPLIWVSTQFVNTAFSEFIKKAAQKVADLLSKQIFGG